MMFRGESLLGKWSHCLLRAASAAAWGRAGGLLLHAVCLLLLFSSLVLPLQALGLLRVVLCRLLGHARALRPGGGVVHSVARLVQDHLEGGGGGRLGFVIADDFNGGDGIGVSELLGVRVGGLGCLSLRLHLPLLGAVQVIEYIGLQQGYQLPVAGLELAVLHRQVGVLGALLCAGGHVLLEIALGLHIKRLAGADTVPDEVGDAAGGRAALRLGYLDIVLPFDGDHELAVHGAAVPQAAGVDEGLGAGEVGHRAEGAQHDGDVFGCLDEDIHLRLRSFEDQLFFVPLG